MDQKSTILIADDEKIGRDVLKGLLIKKGYNLVFATDGIETLNKAKEISPDLILLDLMMPEMDGFEVCRKIRSDPVLAEVPIIMITALDDRKSRLRGIESGADGFMSKPFDGIELQTRVRTVTRLNRYRRLLRTNRELESKISQISALYDILRDLNSATDLDVLLRNIAQKTKKLIGVEKTSIFLWDKANEYLRPIVIQEEDKKHYHEDYISTASEIADWVFQEGKPASIQKNTDLFEENVKREETDNLNSVLCVPLRGKEEIIGVLEVINKNNGIFTEDDQELLEAMADNIALSIERVNLYEELQKAEALLKRENAELRLSVRKMYRFSKIIGKNEKLTDTIKKAQQVALTNSTVLIYGETGTGKELLARAVHENSPRSKKNFVPINCGAMPKDLLESELFGHEKGAFTGATKRRIGRFEEADDGTLFLDEIGDMPLNLQVRLLRVLQEGVIQRLGSNKDIEVDIRIIAATHEDLYGLVTKNRFREDLYYRLKVFDLTLPPLRERKDDIPVLINYFILEYNDKLEKQITGVDKPTMEILCNYDYPGNIRELKHIIESAMVLCKEDVIKTDLIPKELRTSSASNKIVDTKDVKIPTNKAELREARTEAQQQVEILFLRNILSASDGNVTEAARKSGMNRSWLSELIGKHNLDLDQYRNVD
ncbi:response regulator [Candidatus Poribacteria bacterium]|nr:response regulator [Candidatus Poribacteria bacterium]